MSNELTEAERAVAKLLSHSYNYRVEPSRLLGPDEFAGEARKVLAAVRPIIAREALEYEASILEMAVPSADAMPVTFGIPINVWLRDRAFIHDNP